MDLRPSLDSDAERPTPPPAPPPPKASRGWMVGIVGGATLLSRVVGFLRDAIVASFFPKAATDLFFMAFTIPNLLRRLLAEGILSTAFIPVFAGYQTKEEEERRRAYSAALAVFLPLLAIVTLFGILLSPWIVPLFAPGFSGESLATTIFLTRLMFPFLFLVGASSFWFALLQTHRSFAAPALGPVFLNLGMIAAVIFLRPFFPRSTQIVALAIGVLIGGSLQLLLQIVALWRLKIRLGWSFEPQHPAIRSIALLMGPTLLGLGIYQINLMISRAFASYLPEGSLSYLYYSDRLMELPLGVIAVAIATVNLPTLAAKAEGQDWAAFHETLTFGFRSVLFLCIPAGAALFVLREPIIGVLFQRGRFTFDDTLRCGLIFAPAALSLSFVALLRNLTPAFYALKDTQTPVRIAFLSLLINAFASWLFAFPLGYQAMGLSIANGLSTLASVAFSILWLQGKIGRFRWSELGFFTAKVLVASGVMASLLSWLTDLGPWRTGSLALRVLWLSFLVGLGSVAFFSLAYLLKIPEIRDVSTRVLSKLRRRRRPHDGTAA